MVRAAIDVIDAREHDDAIFPKWLKVEPLPAEPVPSQK